MKLKKYSYTIAGLIFLIIAIVHIVKDKPDIYIPSLVFGFMFLFQGLNQLRKKQ